MWCNNTLVVISLEESGNASKAYHSDSVERRSAFFGLNMTDHSMYGSQKIIDAVAMLIVFVASNLIVLMARPPAVEPLHFVLHYSVPLPSSLIIFVASDSVFRCFCPPMLCIPVCHA